MKNLTSKTSDIIPQEIIENKILFIRGKKVMIDKDLSMLYEVETKLLNQAVKRNLNRFPDNWHHIRNDQEVLFTTNILDCVRLIGEGKQPISNFGLPYLSAAHLELLQRCKYVAFVVEDQQLQDFSKQVIHNLRNYYRFRFKDIK